MNSDTRIRSIGLIGLGALAVWVTLSLSASFFLCLNSLRWPTVPVRIVSSGVSTGTSNIGHWWAPEVEYEYAVSGHVYRSTNIRYFMPTFYQQEEARAVRAAYPNGTEAKASYDPHNPSRSVLEPGLPAGLWERALIPAFFWGLIGYILFEMKNPERRLLLRPSNEEAS